MYEVTVKARTLEQAIEIALARLNTTRDKVEVKPLSMGGSGLLAWLGFKKACVLVRRRDAPRTAVTSSAGDTQAEKILAGIVERMGLNAQISSREQDGMTVLDVRVDQEGGLLIGHRGSTLRALRYLIQRIVSEDDQAPAKIEIDVNGYADERQEKLIERAREMASRAVAENRRMKTDPLPASERRVIHQALQEDSRVDSHSVGGGAYRPVVITPKGLSGDEGEREKRGRREGGNRPGRGRRNGPPSGPRNPSESTEGLRGDPGRPHSSSSRRRRPPRRRSQGHTP